MDVNGLRAICLAATSSA